MKMASIDHTHLEFELRRFKLVNGAAALDVLINGVRAAFGNYRQRLRERAQRMAPREAPPTSLRRR